MPGYNPLRSRYFEWLFDTISHDRYAANTKYKTLLEHLFDIEFTWLIDMDENRAIDGINLRYRFGDEFGHDNIYIQRYLDNRPCSVLEMMIALAYRCEETIMGDDAFGDRTGFWFWTMIVNMELALMTNRKYDPVYVDGVVSRFLNRRYDPDGVGGLFITSNPSVDCRDIEIWYQMMGFLNEYMVDHPDF